MGKVGVAAPLHIGASCENIGVTSAVTFSVTVSDFEPPQVFVAVSFTIILPLAVNGTEKFVEILLGLVNEPLGADHAKLCCPCAVPFNGMVSPAQTFIDVGPASTEKTVTGAELPILT